MRPFLTRLFILLLTSISLAATAQTYNITASVSTSSFGTLSSCSGCTINLSPGVVLTINSNVSCTNCTFNGGTINFVSGSVTMNGTDAFNNDTVLVNEALSVNSMDFSGDSVAVNASLQIGSGTTTITNTHMNAAAYTSYINVSMSGAVIHAKAAMVSNTTTITNTSLALSGNGTFTGTGTTISGSNITMTGTSTALTANSSLTITGTDITMNSTSSLTSSGAMSITGGSITSAGKISTGSSITLAGDTVTMTGGYLAASGITTKANGATNTILTMSGTAHDSTGGTLSMTNTNLTMSNSAYSKASSETFSSGTMTLSNEAIVEPTNGFTVTSSTIQMNDSTAITAGSMTVQTGSYVSVGNGSSTSNASITIQNAIKVLDTSTVAISAHNNYVMAGSFSGGSIANNTISCGGAGENACQANTVYGCATMKASGALACIVLAISDLELSASPVGDHAVNLTWSDPQYASADHYIVERSSASGSWTTLASVDANGYNAGSYHFEDASAPAGTDHYRIARVDQFGATVYSATSSVTLASVSRTIRIFPNPAAGHTFYIAVPGTEQLVLNVYTLTGQLILRTTLQGQSQYPVLLPSQLTAGTTVIVQTILPDQSESFPLLLR